MCRLCALWARLQLSKHHTTIQIATAYQAADLSEYYTTL